MSIVRGGRLFPKLNFAKVIDSGQIFLLWTKVIENVIVNVRETSSLEINLLFVCGSDVC